MKRTAVVLGGFVLVVACGSGPEVAPTTTATPITTTLFADPRTPVILDYSPTVSDVGALVFLAVHPDLRLIGVTLPGAGESHCESGVAHTRGVLVALGLGAVPVACGVDEGYGDLNAFPADWRQNADTLDLPEAAPNDARLPAELIADLLLGSPVPVDIVAVGPLTNLAGLLDTHPEVAERIAGITIMGGAVEVAGNVPPVRGWESANGSAEVNFWVDPAAAARVIASGVPVTLVPLDATGFLPADAVFLEVLVSEPATIASGLLAGLWLDAPEWIQGGYYLWDELAAAVLADASIVELETRPLVVDVGEDAVAGWSREDPAGMAVRVALSADRVAFETLFLTTVLGRPTTIERLVATAAEREYFDTVAAISREFEVAQEAVFAAAADDLGFDEDSPEEGWLEVMRAAAPEILSGPMTEFLAALNGVTPPESAAQLHAAWVAALSELLAHQDEILAALEEAARGDGDSELPYFVPFMEACGALTAAAADRGVFVNLGC